MQYLKNKNIFYFISLVVIDYRENVTADTGDFELAYKQKVSISQPYLGAGLSLQGTRITTADNKKISYKINQDIKTINQNKSSVVS